VLLACVPRGGRGIKVKNADPLSINGRGLDQVDHIQYTMLQGVMSAGAPNKGSDQHLMVLNGHGKSVSSADTAPQGEMARQWGAPYNEESWWQVFGLPFIMSLHTDRPKTAYIVLLLLRPRFCFSPPLNFLPQHIFAISKMSASYQSVGSVSCASAATSTSQAGTYMRILPSADNADLSRLYSCAHH